MKLSLKLEYACRVLVQLGSLYGTDEVARIEDLAEKEDISANYLVQILNDLRTGGLVISKRGKLGGYALARPPRETSLSDIVKAIEGRFLEMGDRQTGASGVRVAAVWKKVSQTIQDQISEITLEDMMRGEGETMYYI